MNKLMTVALAGAVALGAAGAAEADTKIAVINLPQIISELPQTRLLTQGSRASSAPASRKSRDWLIRASRFRTSLPVTAAP